MHTEDEGPTLVEEEPRIRILDDEPPSLTTDPGMGSTAAAASTQKSKADAMPERMSWMLPPEGM